MASITQQILNKCTQRRMNVLRRETLAVAMGIYP